MYNKINSALTAIKISPMNDPGGVPLSRSNPEINAEMLR